MFEQQVVADASPLIGIATADQFDLLRRVFGSIAVTDAVQREVCARSDLPGAAELQTAVEDRWVTIVRIEPNPIFADLGAGEAATLTYASAHAALVLMDDRTARSRATEHGVEVTGIGGVLVEAKRRGLVKEVRPLIERLQAGGFRLADEVVHRLLVNAGEWNEAR